ncbi:MAG: STAS domain-containing protein [Phycisphaerales bacterium]|nr:STAS domain-containing protein [Phycisphaerales bacterium]
MIEVSTTRQDGVPIMALTGELDGDGSVAAAARELLDKRGATVVLDLRAVPFVNSAGISELVTLVSQANVQEQRVLMAAATPFVRGLFRTTRLDHFFSMYSSVEEAAGAAKGA